MHFINALGGRPRQKPGALRQRACCCLDAIASRRVGLEPAPEPAGEAGPVCVATNVGVLAAQRVDAGRNEPEERGERRHTRCRAVKNEDREDQKHPDQCEGDASA